MRALEPFFSGLFVLYVLSCYDFSLSSLLHSSDHWMRLEYRLQILVYDKHDLFCFCLLFPLEYLETAELIPLRKPKVF